MRSRYTAYALCDGDYLFRTWHPRTRPAPPYWVEGTQWIGLRILGAEAGAPSDEEGTVTFEASWRDVTTGDIQFNYVPAGEIKFRIIEDRNGNGKWDTGNLVERRQPERAEIYANDEGEDTFATKTNWEIEFTMDMNRIFAPVTMQSLSRLLDEREAQRLRREEEKRLKEGPKKNRQEQERQQQNSNFNAAGGMFNNFR